MATISFSQRPQKNFYSYTGDGHIYSISASEPSEIKDEGGVWYCYFKCTPYHKIEGVTYPIFTKYTLDSKDYYTQVTSNIFYRTDVTYYYYNDKDKGYSTVELKKYYTSSGAKEYVVPNGANELPQVTDDNGNTYYFDTLISGGDIYKGGVFTATKSTSSDGSTTTTYGEILMKKVQNSVSINCFTSNVEQIPNYLKESIESISYNVPDKYFDLYGQLFVEKLVKYMKNDGDEIIQKYGDGLSITTEVNTEKGLIGKITVQKKYHSK